MTACPLWGLSSVLSVISNKDIIQVLHELLKENWILELIWMAIHKIWRHNEDIETSVVLRKVQIVTAIFRFLNAFTYSLFSSILSPGIPLQDLKGNIWSKHRKEEMSITAVQFYQPQLEMEGAKYRYVCFTSGKYEAVIDSK